MPRLTLLGAQIGRPQILQFVDSMLALLGGCDGLVERVNEQAGFGQYKVEEGPHLDLFPGAYVSPFPSTDGVLDRCLEIPCGTILTL
ncbi:hypothetical protein ES703_113943 [subsurface metagenome]